MNEDGTPRNSDNVFQTISELLEEEIKVHEKMHNLLKIKQRAIVKDDVSRLRTCMQEEQTLIKAAKTTMKNLEEHVAELETNLTQRSRAVRLEDIITLAPGDLKTRIDHQRKLLRVSIEKLSRLNLENRYLLNHSLEMVKGMVQLFIRGKDEPIKLYNIKGHISSSDNHHKILNFQI